MGIHQMQIAVFLGRRCNLCQRGCIMFARMRFHQHRRTPGRRDDPRGHFEFIAVSRAFDGLRPALHENRNCIFRP